MRSSSRTAPSASLIAILGLSCVSSIISAAPVSVDGAGNGFPNSNPDQIKIIETAAHGSLPIAAKGAPAGKPLDQDTITSLQLIAFNEIFEVAFFTDLLKNITTNVTGYEIPNEKDRRTLIENLVTIQAQEEVHALNANNGLIANKVEPIQPCQYTFPVATVGDAIGLASTFTEVVLGTLQDVQQAAAEKGDSGFVPGVGSVIGQEGEQTGYFRNFGGKNASSLPFLTRSTRDFAFAALNQNFVVPGSCPNIGSIKGLRPVFPPLGANATALQNNPTSNGKVSFTFTLPSDGPKAEWNANDHYSGLSIVYINQQNAPVRAAIVADSIKTQNNVLTFDALFPFDPATFGNGLTIAALISACASIDTASQVAAAPFVAGPALIEIN